MNLKSFLILIGLLLCSCTGNKTVELYELQKDLSYDPEGGDGIGLVTDLRDLEKGTLTKGTKISIISQDVDSVVYGTERLVEVFILDGEHKGKEIYLGTIRNRDETLKPLKQ